MAGVTKKGKIRWLPLESNPDAINKCVDVLGFDDDLIAFIPQPVYALILCFPDYHKVRELMSPVYDSLKESGAKVPEDIFFMEQSIGNACGTFALFHALANNADKIDIGKGAFKRWLDRAGKLTSNERSSALADDEELSDAHHACAEDGDTEAQLEHVEHHFICFIRKADRLYELDSAAPFPRDCGPTTEAGFLKDAGRECQHLMNQLENISFGAMALVGADFA